MKTAVIIGNGSFPKKEYPLYLLRSADWIVCCDGAFATYLRHCPRVFGRLRLPDAVVGDMDSLPATLRQRYPDLVVPVEEQDDNDQTKAFRHVLEHCAGVEAIHILGATGKREDHTIGNLSLLMEYAREYGLDGLGTGDGPTVDIISDTATAFALRDTAVLQVGEGRRLSLFSPDNSLTISSSGLQWQTSGVVFDNWWKATLNRAVADTVTLTFSHPSVALIIID